MIISIEYIYERAYELGYIDITDFYFFFKYL